MALTKADVREIIEVCWTFPDHQLVQVHPGYLDLIEKVTRPAFVVTNPPIPKRHPKQQAE